MPFNERFEEEESVGAGGYCDRSRGEDRHPEGAAREGRASRNKSVGRESQCTHHRSERCDSQDRAKSPAGKARLEKSEQTARLVPPARSFRSRKNGDREVCCGDYVRPRGELHTL